MDSLNEQAESMLWFLESNPSPMEKVFEHFDQPTAQMLCRARLIWFQGNDCHFYITFRGRQLLVDSGHGRKRLPNLSWKHNPHEMTAERAIELFAPQGRSPLLTSEGVLVNETPRKVKYRKLPDFTVSKAKHLPRKPKCQREKKPSRT